MISGNSVARRTEIFQKIWYGSGPVLQREKKKRIDNVLDTRPLKNIDFVTIFDPIPITVTKSNVFKGLDYSALYWENTIGPMTLFRIYPVRQADYKVL
jgi:hypothetical protein